MLLLVLTALTNVPAYAQEAIAEKNNSPPAHFFPLAPYTKDAKTPLARQSPSRLKIATARRHHDAPEKSLSAPKTAGDQQLLSIFMH